MSYHGQIDAKGLAGSDRQTSGKLGRISGLFEDNGLIKVGQNQWADSEDYSFGRGIGGIFDSPVMLACYAFTYPFRVAGRAGKRVLVWLFYDIPRQIAMINDD